MSKHLQRRLHLAKIRSLEVYINSHVSSGQELQLQGCNKNTIDSICSISSSLNPPVELVSRTCCYRFLPDTQVMFLLSVQTPIICSSYGPFVNHVGRRLKDISPKWITCRPQAKQVSYIKNGCNLKGLKYGKSSFRSTQKAPISFLASTHAPSGLLHVSHLVPTWKVLQRSMLLLLATVGKRWRLLLRHYLSCSCYSSYGEEGARWQCQATLASSPAAVTAASDDFQGLFISNSAAPGREQLVCECV